MKFALLAGITFSFTSLVWADSPTPTASPTASKHAVHHAAAGDSESASGVVTTHKFGKTIVINENNNPATFALGKTVHYVDKAGHEIDRNVIKPGKRVVLRLTGTGKQRHVERVEVED